MSNTQQQQQPDPVGILRDALAVMRHTVGGAELTLGILQRWLHHTQIVSNQRDEIADLIDQAQGVIVNGLLTIHHIEELLARLEREREES